MEQLDLCGKRIVDAAFKVHSTMGPGLLESVYQSCLHKEFTMQGLAFSSQHRVPLIYAGETLSDCLILDFWVERQIVIELKAVEQILPVHKAQILSYMKLSKSRLGYLINFNVPLIKNGINRFIL